MILKKIPASMIFILTLSVVNLFSGIRLVSHSAQDVTEYTVREGEYVNQIAANFGVDPQRIIEENNLQVPDIVYPGQRLLIMQDGAAMSAEKAKDSNPTANSSEVFAEPKEVQDFGITEYNVKASAWSNVQVFTADAPNTDVLSALAYSMGKSYSVLGEGKQRVSLKLIDVPIFRAMEMVAANDGISVEILGTGYVFTKNNG